MSQIIDITDAVVDALNNAPTGTFNAAFTAARSYLPSHELQTLKELTVSVVPRSTEVSSANRSSNQYAYMVDIAVQKKLSSGPDVANDEVDPLMDLTEQIADFFRLRRLDALPAAGWVSTRHDPIYAPDHMDELRVFTSVITLSFRTIR